METIKAACEVYEKKGGDHTKWVNKELTAVIKYLKVKGDPKIPSRKNELVAMFLEYKHRKPLPPVMPSDDTTSNDAALDVVSVADDDDEMLEVDDDIMDVEAM